jgi:DNA-binding transcriptional MerR regulator
VATRNYQSIGEVLVSVKTEFPDITISKIRFLESEGLIEPERTPSGYRKFYEKDVDRLRSILRMQRDEYLPLKVIKDRLFETDALDGQGGDGGSIEPVAAPEHGPDGARYFDGDDYIVLSIVKDFFRFGVEPRHLTMYKHFEEREADFFESIVMPQLRQRNPDARRGATASLVELARASRKLKQALLRTNLRQHLT